MPNAFPISELDAPPSSFQIYALKALSLIKTMKSAELSKKKSPAGKGCPSALFAKVKKVQLHGFLQV